MNLTQPTLTDSATPAETATDQENSAVTALQSTNLSNEATAASVVRVMAYLAPDEAVALDDLWMKVRRLPTRPSKSDILRAAFLLAVEKEEELTNILSQQHNNTLSRQRARKSRV